jgi:hypothetical protein
MSTAMALEDGGIGICCFVDGNRDAMRSGGFLSRGLSAVAMVGRIVVHHVAGVLLALFYPQHRTNQAMWYQK